VNYNLFNTTVEARLLLQLSPRLNAPSTGLIKYCIDHGGTVLSEIGFPPCAVESKFAPHFRQGLFSPLAKFEIAFRYKLVSTKVLRRNC
jgi:hypothetical protein